MRASSGFSLLQSITVAGIQLPYHTGHMNKKTFFALFSVVFVAQIGMGIVSPLGNDVDSFWKGLCEGRSGVRRIDRFYDPLPITEEDKEEFLGRFKDRPDSPFARLIKEMQLPKVKTVTDRMIVDSAGNLWVKTNEDRKEGESKSTAFDVFDSDGRYDTRVWLEFIPFFFPDGKMYRLVDDEETGAQQLKRYRIVWN